VASDKELIRRFLGGERAAFDELVVRHREQVYATAYRMVGNAETAEEIAQEVFLRVFRGLGKFRHKANFTTWLYRITMNLCYDEFSRRKKATEMLPQSGGATAGATAEAPHESLASEERKKWLERQIETLPFKQKSTLTLRIFQEMSFKEIGRALGCSAGSARVNYRHAILKLKDALARSGEEL
jgi:RNA polymerase sigma-70 factor (ECF subfamily)